MKMKRLITTLGIAALGIGGLISVSTTQANDWNNTGIGDWSNAANWNGGIPDNTGGWAIGNVNNGGTAIISTLVPNVSEAWAGNDGVAGHIIVTNGGTMTVNNWLVVGRTGGPGNTPTSTLTVGSGGVINKNGDGFIIGDNNNCKGQMFVTGCFCGERQVESKMCRRCHTLIIGIMAPESIS